MPVRKTEPTRRKSRARLKLTAKIYYDLESYDESYDEGMIPEATNDGTME